MFVGLVLLFLAVAVFSIRVGPLFGFGSPPLSSRLSQYESIVSDINSGEIAPDASGICQTPESYAGVTPRGEVFIGASTTGKTLVLFPTWYGRGGDVDGYLHASAPLVGAEYYSIDWGAGGTRRHIDVGAANMLSVSLVHTNWYWATRRLD